MKILVIALVGAPPEDLLADERLGTIRSLMEAGCYGRLAGPVPAGALPSWACLAMSSAEASTTQARAVWEQVAEAGGRSILVGVAPGDLPRPVNGIAVGDFVAGDESGRISTLPSELAVTIDELVGTSPPAKAGEQTDQDRVFDASRKQFTVARHLIENEPWSYLHIVDTGLEAVRHQPGPKQVLVAPDGAAAADAVRDYFLHLDHELTRLLELLTEDTLVLVASVPGAGCPEDVEPSHQGTFVLAGSQLPPFGAIEGARWIDVAPTLLELAGSPPLPDAQGRNFLEDRKQETAEPAGAIDDDELVRERLRGLGYIG